MAGTATDKDDGMRELLHEHGLRYSRPRAAILGLFGNPGQGHLSAEAVHQELQARGVTMSLSTVYLNLGVLREASLLREFSGANGESIFDINVNPHHHVICAETGDIFDVPGLEVDGVPLGRYLREQVERATGWVIEEPRFTLRGIRQQTASGKTNLTE